MKYLIITFALFIPAYSYGDWQVNCSNINLNNLDIKHCGRLDDENKKVKYLFEYKKLIEDMSKQVTKADNITYKHAIKKIKKSHELWINVITIDCDLWSHSPLNSGSRNPDYRGCLADKYSKRIEQIKIYREAWII